jgi:hypothetical protein
MVALLLVFWETSTLISIVATLIYIPTKSISFFPTSLPAQTKDKLHSDIFKSWPDDSHINIWFST